jgi:hypothetical protein
LSPSPIITRLSRLSFFLKISCLLLSSQVWATTGAWTPRVWRATSVRAARGAASVEDDSWCTWRPTWHGQGPAAGAAAATGEGVRRWGWSLTYVDCLWFFFVNRDRMKLVYFF